MGMQIFCHLNPEAIHVLKCFQMIYKAYMRCMAYHSNVLNCVSWITCNQHFDLVITNVFQIKISYSEPSKALTIILATSSQ